MIIILKEKPEKTQFDNLVTWLKSMNLKIHLSEGEKTTILGLVGDTSEIDPDLINALDIVDSVRRISEPYKNANRKFHPLDTVVAAGEHGESKIGGGNFGLIAGPCSVESEEQVLEIAQKVKASGATFLRGGAFKPRTSPYSFQGMRGTGIEILLKAKQITGLPIVTEIMDMSQIELFEDVDVIQVGARNMQNFEMLKELGHIDKPILLKRGLSSTMEELLMSAEYIMAGGNENVILCERGIRTFETATRNTLDLSIVPLLKEKTHLPVIVDPSHATGIRELVLPMAMAATAAGADGLMIEVHNDPEHALCDGPQSLTPAQFNTVAGAVAKIREACKPEGGKA
ncbi:MAG: 3-deoxy-7-phosphoheptulonate synthase [Firmicutes bacterium]|nr:3-deoxy-7-phosphoheptulonate synthase [Bacillota bacterium]